MKNISVPKLTGFLLCLLTLTSKGQQVLPLYPGEIPNALGGVSTELVHGPDSDPEAYTGVTIPTLQVFLPSAGVRSKSAVIVMPGGAYRFLAYREEGTKIARAFAERGVTAFVLKYRLPSDASMKDKSIGPLQDAQQAMLFVRSNAAQYGIDPSKIGVIGFSAGGHLAATVGTHFKTRLVDMAGSVSLRPDFMMLVYPVISMQDSLMHRGSRENLLGKNAPDSLVRSFSADLQVDRSTPPTYLTHAMDDGLVTFKNSVAFYEALGAAGVKREMRLADRGDHGFIQRILVSEWLDPIIAWMKKGGFL